MHAYTTSPILLSLHRLWIIGLVLLLSACNLSHDEVSETVEPLTVLEHSTLTPAESSTPVLSSNSSGAAQEGGCVIRTDWQTYVIQTGDTLGQLAERSGITLEALVQANCINNPDVIAVGQTVYVPRGVNTGGSDGYLRTLPDGQCYFFTFMMGSPFVVYSGANVQVDKNPLPITIPANVYLPASARSEYRTRVRLPDGQQLWIDNIVGVEEGACGANQVVQTIASPPDQRCYTRLDMHAPPPMMIDDNGGQIDFIPTFTWLLVTALNDRDYKRIALNNGQQAWIPPMQPHLLQYGDCASLPVLPSGPAG